MRPYPLILNIHGGPASAFSDRLAFGWHDWGQMLAHSGYAVRCLTLGVQSVGAGNSPMPISEILEEWSTTT